MPGDRVFSNFVKHHSAIARIITTITSRRCHAMASPSRSRSVADRCGRLFQPVVSVQRRPSLYRQHFIVRLPIVPRVNPHTVARAPRSSFLGLLAVLVEVESHSFWQLSHWSANRGCDRRWIHHVVTTQILVDRFGFCRGLTMTRALPIFTLPNLILPGMRAR